MSNLSTAVMIANEIVKQVDFAYANDQAIANISVALQSILSGGNADYVIGGKVVPYMSGGMNFVIEPIFGHCRSTGVDIVDTEATGAVSVEAADATLDRLDIVEVRGTEEEYDYQQRRFRDPETKVESLDTVPTKKRIKLEVKVKKGANGSVTAPLADTGYIKIAELHIPAGTVSIAAENIRNVAARANGLETNTWTVEKARTFNPGYLSEIIAKFLMEHGEDGKHLGNVIKAANIKFGINVDDVKGKNIPTGEPMGILGQNYTSQVSITDIIVALAQAVNAAYPYANNLLGRYVYIQDLPVAASTGPVDIIAGGEMTIDGITCTVGQMVFLKDQEDNRQNGFWEVQTGQWNRYEGYRAENAGCFDHKFILVEAGSVNQGRIFYLDGNAYVVDTDAMNFRESMFSTQDLPGKALIRGPDGKSNEDKKRDAGILSLRLDLTSHADMVDGMGRNLLDVLKVSSIPATMTELRRRCNNDGEIDASKIPDFRGLMIGDYLDIPSLTIDGQLYEMNPAYQNTRIVIAGLNTFKGAGDTENEKNHVLFVFRNILMNRRMNPTDTNTGGYPASEMRAWLEGANGDGSGSYSGVTTAAFLNGLKAALGDYLYTHRGLFSLKGNWEWRWRTVFLPTTHETWGAPGWAETNYDGGFQAQFPLYQKSVEYKLKRNNGSRMWWWNSSPSASSAAYFCVSSGNGNSNYYGASAAGGVAPAFCVA
jgi:hypothetical protein